MAVCKVGLNISMNIREQLLIKLSVICYNRIVKKEIHHFAKCKFSEIRGCKKWQIIKQV